MRVTFKSKKRKPLKKLPNLGSVLHKLQENHRELQLKVERGLQIRGDAEALRRVLKEIKGML